MPSFLMVVGRGGTPGDSAEDHLRREVERRGGAVRTSWTSDGPFPAAALVHFDTQEDMEALASDFDAAGAVELIWLGVGETGTDTDGEDSGHIKAGRGGGHIKAGNASA